MRNNRGLILVASILVNITIGAGYAWSVFIQPLSKNFGWSPEGLALAFTINMGIIPIPMIFGSKLLKIYGEKKNIIVGGLIYGFGFFATGYVNSLYMLYITYGIAAGIGSMTVLAAVLSNTVRFFPNKSGLALGLSLAGFSTGALIIAPVVVHLIGLFGVMSSFKILGIVMIIIISLSSLLIKDAPETYENKELVLENSKNSGAVKGQEEKNWRQMIKDPRYYFLVLIFICSVFTGVMIISNASPIGQEMYYLPVTFAAFFVGVISLANGCGRIIGGSLSDKFGSMKVFTGINILTIIVLLALANSRSSVVFAIGMTGIGFGYGSCIVAIASILKKNYGAINYSANYGFTFTAYTLVSFFASRIVANIKSSNNGDYTKAFYLGVVLAMVGLATLLVYRIFLKKYRTETSV